MLRIVQIEDLNTRNNVSERQFFANVIFLKWISEGEIMIEMPKMSLKEVSMRTFSIIKKVDFFGLVILFSFQIFLGIFPSINFLIMQKIINMVQLGDFDLTSVFRYVGFLIVVTFFNYVASQLDNYNSFSISKKITLYIELEMLNKTKSLTLKDFENVETYNIIQRAQAQSGEAIFGHVKLLLNILKTLVIIISNSMILIFWKWWILLLIILLSIVKIIVLSKYSRETYSVHKARTTKEREKWYYHYLLTSDFAFRELQLFNTYDFFISRFNKLSKKFINQDKHIMKKYVRSESFLAILDVLVVGLSIAICIYDIKIGIILVGNFVININCITLIKSSMDSLAQDFITVEKETLDLSYLFEFFDLECKGEADESSKKIEVGKIEKIEVKNVSFSYSNSSELVLKNISLIAKKGEAISIVGLNGSGKSTLLKLIAGFYEEYTGDIFINDINIKDISIKSYRKEIGMLFQDFAKYEMSLRENISMSKLEERENDGKIIECLDFVGENIEYIGNLDKQLGYWFEEGTQLSGGQWIKIAIARALFRDSSVIILDEPNASLDPLSESEIFKKYKELITDKVSLVITHRLASAKYIASKILVFENGKIVSEGTHENLLENCDLYRNMYEKDQTILER